MTSPKVLVITVTYNAMPWIGKFFESLKASTVPTDVIIIDNGSTDGTQEHIRQNYPEAHLVQSDSNLGFGKANNVGLKYAIENSYDYVYLLNQDAWIEKDCLGLLIDAHKRHSGYGILSPVQIQANGCHMDRNFLHTAAERTRGASLLNDTYFGNTAEIYDVDEVMAAHWLISMECVRTVGGFSPAFYHYGEDYNYIDRAAYHGFKTGIVPKAIGIHDREDRPEPPDADIRRLNLSTLIKINDITEEVSWSSIAARYVKMIFKAGTLKHFRFLFKILFNSGKVKRYKEASKGRCAFLDIE